MQLSIMWQHNIIAIHLFVMQTSNIPTRAHTLCASVPHDSHRKCLKSTCDLTTLIYIELEHAQLKQRVAMCIAVLGVVNRRDQSKSTTSSVHGPSSAYRSKEPYDCDCLTTLAAYYNFI